MRDGVFYGRSDFGQLRVELGLSLVEVGALGLADRRDQLSRSAQGDPDNLVADEIDDQIAGRLAAFACLCRARCPDRT